MATSASAKAADLNALLRGDGKDRFARCRNVAELEREIRDHARHGHAAGESARQFVGDGTPAQPRFGRRQAREHALVTEGYAIPLRVDVSLPGDRRGTRACMAATRGSILIRAPCPTSTRTRSAKARSSARASTMSTHSNAH